MDCKKPAVLDLQCFGKMLNLGSAGQWLCRAVDSY